jgi:aldo/keto reductase family protein
MTLDHQPTVALPGGRAMPMLGFGTWQMTGTTCYEAVRYALEVGYRHFDTATVYRNERDVGRAVRDSGVPRGAGLRRSLGMSGLSIGDPERGKGTGGVAAVVA